MEKLVITGGNKLEGQVTLSGAKNSALKLLTASVLSSERIRLFNIPTELEDIKTNLDMLRGIGSSIESKNNDILIDNSTVNQWKVPEQEHSVRTSLLMLGGLLGKFGRARVPLPGGCKIGDRKYDLHVYALEKLGAKVRETADGYLEAECRKLKGAEIEFPIRTTGGTENAIITSCLAKGETIIKNAHTRPEVTDLVNFLKSMGAKIDVIGSGWIVVQGVDSLYGTNYTVMPDNVEALTFIMAGAVTDSDIEIMNCPITDLEIPMVYLRESGINFHRGINSVRVSTNKALAPLDISTGPYPGINSDFQPLFAAYAIKTGGTSRITDIRFEDRFDYISELVRMGAKISRQANTITIMPGALLKGSQVTAHDLRAGAALLIAALFAEGQTEIADIYQIDRGYDKIDQKLSCLGASIERVKG